MLVSIFLLAILTLGAVSAAEDSDALASDNVAEEQVSSSVDDVDLIADDEDDWDDDYDDDWDDDEEYFNPIKTPDGYIEYNSNKNITFTLSEDAKGTLNVSSEREYDSENDEYILKNPTSYELIGGKAVIPLKDLSIGKHYLYFAYQGDYQDKVNEYFEWHYVDISIYPVVIPRYFFIENDVIVKFSIPDGITGNVSAYEDNDENLIKTVDISEGEINLGKFNSDPTILFKFTDSNGDSLYTDVLGYLTLNVISENPDWEMELEYDKEIIKSNDIVIEIINIPSYIDNDKFVFLLDGKEVESEFSGYLIVFAGSELDETTHNFEIKFLGDDYFNPTSAEGSFTISNCVITIPESYDMGNDEEFIKVQLPDGANVRIVVKANSKVISDETFEDFDEGYVRISLNELSFGINDIEVNVTGDYEKQQTGQINATYYMGIGQAEVVYGDGEFVLDVPADLTSTITVFVDGIAYKAVKKVTVHDMEYINFIVTVPTDLSIGNHSVKIQYDGDKKYGARNVTTTLTVVAKINVPEYTIDKNNEEIVLILPENATGVLNVKIYKYVENVLTFISDNNVSLVKGVAKFSFKDFSFGKYKVNVNYTGDDYEINMDNIPEEGAVVVINPDVSYPSKMIQGDNNLISINLPGVTGRLEVGFDGSYFEANLINGKASLSLKDLPVGLNYVRWYLYESYTVNDEYGDSSTYEDCYYECVEITVQKPAIKAGVLTMPYTAGSLYKVQITGVDKNLIIGDKVTFKINNKVIGTGKIDKNGYASIKINQNPGVYKITTVYKTASITKKLTVKHIVTLKTVKVKKSAKKLVIQVTVKVGKKPVAKKNVAVKFNGKKYTVKTNKNGVAKLTIKKSVLKKLKVGKKVTYQATYLKDTVKKTVKVKK